MPEVTIRYFAAARSAAGESSATAEARSIGDLVTTVSVDRPELARVLSICTFLMDGERAESSTPLTQGALVDALPPFAGG
ncbi:MoaD/ThiS family protein [Kribbella solani]|uniref:Molybdopterin converting factor small subunit n=1 Tax=Kribbella solani TaxID=236067 RepID=A0A841DWC2_9ACTN|nr:MoaD/ThiS family protein [Kribbella solani]MBB5981050.1 molybdopterin converting factor small subunit [Kribbella solani]MDX2974069.1 MoaD/ThiS family protein [Kribbella solani]MDX3003624.1 MoaD/ThiS family protein [Kribbella solani]